MSIYSDHNMMALIVLSTFSSWVTQHVPGNLIVAQGDGRQRDRAGHLQSAVLAHALTSAADALPVSPRLFLYSKVYTRALWMEK